MPDTDPDPTPTLEAQLAEARATIDRLERANRIDALLRDAEAIDLEAARLLTEHAVAAMDAPDVAAAVEDLKRHRPYLFRRRAPLPPASQAATFDDASPVETAADRAAATGDRRDLLAYLRLRRR